MSIVWPSLNSLLRSRPLRLDENLMSVGWRCPCLPPAGEYVAVEMIESVFGKNEMVEQIWVYGSSFESALVAVVVPNKAPLMQWAKEQVCVGDQRHVEHLRRVLVRQSSDHVCSSMRVSSRVLPSAVIQLLLAAHQ